MTHAPQRWENGLPDRSPTFLPAIGADQRDLKALNLDIYKKCSFIEITWNNTKWRFLIFSYPNFSSWVESKICHNKSDIVRVTSYDNIYWTSTCFIAQLQNKLSQQNPLGSSMKNHKSRYPKEWHEKQNDKAGCRWWPRGTPLVTKIDRSADVQLIHSRKHKLVSLLHLNLLASDHQTSMKSFDSFRRAEGQSSIWGYRLNAGLGNYHFPETASWCINYFIPWKCPDLLGFTQTCPRKGSRSP